MSRVQMLEAFEAHKAKIAKSLIDGGDGKRVRDYLERHVRLADFEAGWHASREAVVIQLPEKCEYADPDSDYAKGHRQGKRDVVDCIEGADLKVRL